MININKISKHFDKKVVLDEFSFNIEKNKNYGLIGANGSGKTTLLKIIGNLMLPDNGEISADEDISIFYVNNNSRSFFLRLSGWDNLFFFGALNNKKRNEVKEIIESLFSLFDYEHILSKNVNTLSVGQIQILGIMRALLTDPKLLLIDEVITNLDASNTKKILEVLELYRKNKKIFTYINCSHNHDLLGSTCNRIIEI